jgi:hypothetical protein
MLNQGKKLFYYSLLFFFIVSCTDKATDRYRDFSKSNIGNEEYNSIYGNLKDSVERWISQRLKIAEALRIYNYKIDSLICFNKENNKLVGCIMLACNKPSCSSDDLHFLYGVMIKNRWYFVFGPTVVLIRSTYQLDRNTPIPFEKMHEIAMKEIYSGYLKKEDKGFLGNLFSKPTYQINEDFFSDLADDAYNMPFTTQEAWEASYLKLVGENWQKRDTTNQIP